MAATLVNNSFLSASFAVLKLVRVVNLMIIVLSQYLTAIFLINGGVDWLETLVDPNLFLLALSTSLIAASGYIINDYYDVKIDYINKPDKVVIGNTLKRRAAMALHVWFFSIGAAIGLFLSWKIFVIDVFAIFWLWLYSNQLKRLPLVGNITVALLTGLAIAVVGVYHQFNQSIVFTYAFFAFSISLIREVVKDVEDLRGDATFGCKTLPVIWGIRKTKNFLYTLIACFLFTLFYFANEIGNQTLINFFFILLLPIFFFVYKMYKADTTREFTFLSNFCKILMLLGIISMSFFVK